MRPIAKLVEAIVELETTGRLSEPTKADLIALMAAENYRHPSAVLETTDGTERR